MSAPRYQLVRLRNGAVCVRSIADDETFHPGIGPVAEADALYVRQLRLPERVRETDGEFVIWDVGLGAAANALTALRLIGRSADFSPLHPSPHDGMRNEFRVPKRIRLVSFDHTCEALSFAIQHAQELQYPIGFEDQLIALTTNRRVQFNHAGLEVEWTLALGDFPKSLEQNLPCPPHAILFDPHSPQKNPAMWTVAVFTNLFRQLDPQRPCALANFTRSTLARAAMLLGGFYVGTGHATGLKEETTVAANQLELLAEPLDRRWLERARRSDSAEPLWEPVYRRAKLNEETWERLQRHPQFSS